MRVDRWRDDVVPFPTDEAAAYRAAGYWTGRTIGEQFHRVASAHPHDLAVVTSAASYTYSEIDERTDRIAAGLVQLGFLPGDAVLLQIENSVEAVLAWYGLIKAGTVPVATLAAHRGHELHEIGTITEATGHLVQADHPKADLVELARRMAAASPVPRTVLTVGGDDGAADGVADGVVRIEDLGAAIDPADARAVVERVAAEIDGEDVAVFQLSGGTTATPKVIPRLHDEYWYNASAYARRLGWDRSTRVAHVLPMIHNAGIVCCLHSAHSVGAAVVLSSPDPDVLLPTMAASGTTDTMAYPALALEWGEHPTFEAAAASLRRIVLTGTKVTDPSFALFERRGIRVLGLYGAGEGLVMVTPPDDPAEVRQHALGTPLSDLDDVRVLVPGTEETAPDDTPGELCFGGPYTLRGYLRSPERNAEAFTSDGLYRSGDLVAARTIAGVRCLTFEGRAKDQVVRGGEKVNAAEIEALVVQMPGVARAALVPVPDPRLGERGCLFLEMLPGVPAPELTDVIAHLDAREVAKFKWPERLEILDAIPRTRVGKIDKRALVERVGVGSGTPAGTR
ncbi:AMP-binding protein [Pseudonocardia endophytica]|uniref:Non-ribosomal peptide synthetase component E (Peptide arylation enzyme) n=1 Tax=Pseudonocardia endophytica TaxID=401976 RepID=A0A4R1HJH5_PSEEN|nr:AMP-binding protein [Pseudonocardia endophytica]TCK22008.1 non-ribosomal peptide synthetase component E (peptide arylation enzyme) [Pseudonocardia endophytica]